LDMTLNNSGRVVVGAVTEVTVTRGSTTSSSSSTHQ